MGDDRFALIGNNDRNDVETCRHVVGIFLIDEVFGDFGEFDLLLPIDCSLRIVFFVTCQRFDFDEHQDIAVGSDDVDFADRAGVIALENPKTGLLQESAGEPFATIP